MSFDPVRYETLQQRLRTARTAVDHARRQIFLEIARAVVGGESIAELTSHDPRDDAPTWFILPDWQEIDGADVDELRPFLDWGVLDGTQGAVIGREWRDREPSELGRIIAEEMGEAEEYPVDPALAMRLLRKPDGSREVKPGDELVDGFGNSRCIAINPNDEVSEKNGAALCQYVPALHGKPAPHPGPLPGLSGAFFAAPGGFQVSPPEESIPANQNTERGI